MGWDEMIFLLVGRFKVISFEGTIVSLFWRGGVK